LQPNGVAIPAGHYGVWMDLSEAEFLPEELILDPNPERFHTDPPPVSDEQIRMPVTRTEGGEFKDVLTWDFEAIRSDGATLALVATLGGAGLMPPRLGHTQGPAQAAAVPSAATWVERRAM